MTRPLPKKRTKILTWLCAILILLCGILIGGYLVLKSGYGTARELSAILGGKIFEAGFCEPNPQNAQSDVDEDGLPDWQEIQIYKSDPCRQDTDGDGYFDGEEVDTGYDPTKAAPGDEMLGRNPQKPRSLPRNLTLALKQNLSEQITQNKISAFNSVGELLSYEDIDKYPAIQQTINEIILSAQKDFTPEKIDENQLNITQDNSPAAFKKYMAAVSQIIKSATPLNKNFSTEAEMILNSFETGNFEEMKIAKIHYQEVYRKIRHLEVPIPNDFMPIHKEILEIFSTIEKVYGALQNSTEDPLKANLAIYFYQEANNRFLKCLENFSIYLSQHPEY